MPSQLVTTGLARLDQRLATMAGIDFTPLMMEWEVILEEDNRRGLLTGLDGYARLLAPLAASTIKRRKSAVGKADSNAPPLIPAWEKSRAIANFRTSHARDGATRWWSLGVWDNVVSKQGVSFLPFHFRGEGRLPKRDLAMVRPEAVRAARANLREFIQQQFRRP